MKRLLKIEKEIDDCNDCIFCSAWSADGEAFALCLHPDGVKELHAHGKEGIEIMVMDIPENCPLKKVEQAVE